MDTRQEAVQRALAYPFAIPTSSFLLERGNVRIPPGVEPDQPQMKGRTPLLAYGSNAAPKVLARKLGETTHDAPVLGLRATLVDFDVVYSAHISRYGSIPANLRRSQGTKLTAFVLYLNVEQLDLVTATEPNYEPGALSEIECVLANGESLHEISAYLSRHGCLAIEGSEVALSEVEARARMLPAMRQSEIQEHLRATLAPEQTLEQFVAGNARDPDLAQQRTKTLQKATRVSRQRAANLCRAKRANSA